MQCHLVLAAWVHRKISTKHYAGLRPFSPPNNGSNTLAINRHTTRRARSTSLSRVISYYIHVLLITNFFSLKQITISQSNITTGSQICTLTFTNFPVDELVDYRVLSTHWVLIFGAFLIWMCSSFIWLHSTEFVVNLVWFWVIKWIAQSFNRFRITPFYWNSKCWGLNFCIICSYISEYGKACSSFSRA